MIYGETIKTGFAQRLKELYPDVEVFKEKEDEKDLFPNFFILQLTLDTQEDRKDHYFETYYVNIRYREAADTSIVDKLQQKLDKMGQDMVRNIVYINVNGLPKKLRNCRYEKIDNVVHYFANVTVQVEKEKQLLPIMNEIKTKVNLI